MAQALVLGAHTVRKPSQKIDFLAEKPILNSKMVEKKVEIEGAGPPRLDPQRNSVPGPATDVKNGGMATHLVTNLADLGSVGVPAPARTPLGGLGMGVELKMGSKPGLPEPKWRGRLERNRGSGILPRIPRIQRIPRKRCQELRFRPPLTTRRSLRIT